MTDYIGYQPRNNIDKTIPAPPTGGSNVTKPYGDMLTEDGRIKYTAEKRAEYDALVMPLMNFIRMNLTPQTKVIVDRSSAEILVGEAITYHPSHRW